MKELVKKERAGRMSNAKKACFDALAQEEREKWEEMSKRKLEEAQAAYKAKVEELASRKDAGPCTDPEEVQEYVHG